MKRRLSHDHALGEEPARDHDPLLDRRALARASQAMRCLPFRRAFYDHVAEQALSSATFCRLPEAGQLCWGRMGPERVEAHFIWLIRLGVLRREVDGQGLTERVRLTPMGRELLGNWRGEIPRAPLAERIQHQLRRSRPRL
jgi:hypothetical protein